MASSRITEALEEVVRHLRGEIELPTVEISPEEVAEYREKRLKQLTAHPDCADPFHPGCTACGNYWPIQDLDY